MLVSLTFCLPLARFYTRSVYFDMAQDYREERGQITQKCGLQNLRMGVRGSAWEIVWPHSTHSARQGILGVPFPTYALLLLQQRSATRRVRLCRLSIRNIT